MLSNRASSARAQRTGTAWYVGIPKSGKTTLARAHAIEAARENRFPILVIDSEGVAQLEGFAHARSVEHARAAVFERRLSCAYHPNDREEVWELLRSCRKPGRVNVLIDEAHLWLSAGSSSRDPMLQLMRSHRHARVRLFLTTQHLSGDVPQAAISCAPEVFVFRCTGQPTLDRMETQWGIRPEVARNLRQFHYLRHYEGF